MAVGFRGRRVDVQRAELAAERLVLIQGHLLIAKEDHLMVHQRVMDFPERLVAQRLGEVHALDLGADDRADRVHLNCFISHAISLLFRRSIRSAAGSAT